MNIHFEIREKGANCNTFIMRGMVSDWCAGHKAFKKMIEKQYPTDKYAHTFWTEIIETRFFVFE